MLRLNHLAGFGALRQGHPDPYWNNVDFLLHMNGPTTAASLKDEKGNVSGTSMTATLSGTQSKFGNSSLYCASGQNATLTVPTNANPSLPFTIEGWFYPINVGNQQSLFSNAGMSTELRIMGDGSLQYYSNTSQAITSAASVITNDAWHHIAVVDNGASAAASAIWLNGARVAYGGFAFQAPGWDTTFNLGLGQYSAFDGYIDELRVTRDIARYNTSSTSIGVPSSIYPDSRYEDPYWKDSILLLNMNGTDASTTFTDAVSGLNLTASGNAQIDTGDAANTDVGRNAFGNSSAKFDGTGDYISTLASVANAYYNLGSGLFTIEFWMNATALADATDDILALVDASNYLSIKHITAAQGKISIEQTGAATTNGSGAVTMTTGNWYHVAIVRNSTSASGCTVYINGAQQFTFTCSITFASAYIRLGSRQAAANAFAGYLDDIRITKGVARYTSDFSAPGKQF